MSDVRQLSRIRPAHVAYVPSADVFDRLRALIGARERAYHIAKMAAAKTPFDIDYAQRREADWIESVRAVEEVVSKLQCGVPQ